MIGIIMSPTSKAWNVKNKNLFYCAQLVILATVFIIDAVSVFISAITHGRK